MLKFSVISPNATYQLNTSVGLVDEGQSSTITLTTTGVQEGQSIPYTIGGVGITTDDISGEPLTGNFVVSGGVATKTLNIASDVTSEGQETLTMSLGNGTNVSLAINDTSATPVAGDAYYDNVTLLMHMDGANNGTTFTDEKGKVVTPHGGINTTTSQYKFGNTSMKSNGTGYLTVPNSIDFQFGSDYFTVEAWVYYNNVTGYKTICSTYQNASTGFELSLYNNYFCVWLSGDVVDISGTTTIQPNTWYHVAVSGKTGAIRLFVNGVQEGGTFTGSTSLNSTAQFSIGALTIGSTSYNVTDGYIDELRITKGVARYTSNFTVPTAAFPNVKNENIDPFWNNVVLGMHMDGTNGSTTFVDETGMVPTRSGLSVISTAQSKFGSSSLLLSDVNDGLIFPTTNAVAFGTGDFTVEMWVRPTNLTVNSSNGYTLLETRPPATNGNYLTVWISNIGLFSMYDGMTSSTATTTFQINTWYHCAVVRKNGQLSLYVNGQQEASVASNVDFLASNILIGLNAFRATAPATNFYGYIDDLRITKGVGRYVTDFVPPTRSFAEMA